MRPLASGDRSARLGSGSTGTTASPGASECVRSDTGTGSVSRAAFIAPIDALYSTKRARFKRFASPGAPAESRASTPGRSCPGTWPRAWAAPFDERGNPPPRATVADGGHRLRVIVRQQADLPVIVWFLADVRQTAHRPLVTRLHDAASQQPIGLVEQRDEIGAKWPAECGAAQLVDQVQRLLQRADQVTLLQPRALGDAGQVLAFGPGESHAVEIDRQRPRHLQTVTLLLAQHATVQCVEDLPQAVQTAGQRQPANGRLTVRGKPGQCLCQLGGV